MSNGKLRSKQPKNLTTLWVISLFVSLSEVTLGVAASQTLGGIQIALVAFVISFPVIVAFAFFIILWFKPWVFYSPSEYTNINVQHYIEALKGTPIRVIKQTSDIEGEYEIVGNPDRMKLLFKVAGKIWERSTKAMKVGSGCLVQTSSKFLTSDCTWNLAEALTFVPNVDIAEEADGKGRYLIQINDQPKGGNL